VRNRAERGGVLRGHAQRRTRRATGHVHAQPVRGRGGRLQLHLPARVQGREGGRGADQHPAGVISGSRVRRREGRGAPAAQARRGLVRHPAVAEHRPDLRRGGGEGVGSDRVQADVLQLPPGQACGQILAPARADREVPPPGR